MDTYNSDSDYEGSPQTLLVRTYKASCEYCGYRTSVTNPDRTGGICYMCQIKINASNVLIREIRKWFHIKKVEKRYKSVMTLKKLALPIDIIIHIVYHI
jgi:hypothetical protein